MNIKKKMLALTMMVLCVILVSACSTMGATSKEEKQKNDQNPQNVQTVKNNQEQKETTSPATEEPATITKEENLITIFNSKLEDQEKVAELVKNLEGVDFSKLTNGQENVGIDIMDYLVKHSDKITTDNYNALFLASKNQFDGVLSESYASIVGQVFMKDKEAVIITLSSIEDEATQKQVISSIGYNLSYVEYTKIKKELDEFKESTPLGEKEKSIVNQILKKVENPY